MIANNMIIFIIDHHRDFIKENKRIFKLNGYNLHIFIHIHKNTVIAQFFHVLAGQKLSSQMCKTTLCCFKICITFGRKKKTLFTKSGKLRS